MKAVQHVLGLMVAVLWVVLVGTDQAGAEAPALAAEVLERSGPVPVAGLPSGALHFAIVHHRFPQDQARLSRWLRNQGGAPVTFVTKDGTAHQGVLAR